NGYLRGPGRGRKRGATASGDDPRLPGGAAFIRDGRDGNVPRTQGERRRRPVTKKSENRHTDVMGVVPLSGEDMTARASTRRAALPPRAASSRGSRCRARSTSSRG